MHSDVHVHSSYLKIKLYLNQTLNTSYITRSIKDESKYDHDHLTLISTLMWDNWMIVVSYLTTVMKHAWSYHSILLYAYTLWCIRLWCTGWSKEPLILTFIYFEMNEDIFQLLNITYHHRDRHERIYSAFYM